MAKRLQLELPDRLYDQLARMTGSERAVRREILAAIRSRLGERQRPRRESILSVIAAGDGDPLSSTQVDDELYGLRRCR